MDIYEKIKRGDYEGTLPFVSYKADPNKNLLYDQEQRQLQQKFEDDLIAQFELTYHPKAALAFRLAWEEGHSGGYNEIATYFERFAELLLP